MAETVLKWAPRTSDSLVSDILSADGSVHYSWSRFPHLSATRSCWAARLGGDGSDIGSADSLGQLLDADYTGTTGQAASYDVASSNAELAYETRLTELQNAQARAEALADGQVRVATARANAAASLALATASRDYELAQLENYPAEAAQSTENWNTLETARKEAQETQTEALADAELAWAKAMAAADATFDRQAATAAKSLSYAQAGIDAGYDKGVAQSAAVRDKAYARIQAGQWNQSTALENTCQTALAQAQSQFNSAQFAAASGVLTALAQTVDLPWADFQAQLAAAKATWWQSFRAEYLDYVSDVNAAATSYQAAVSTHYIAQADAFAAADLAHARQLADDELARQHATADAEYTYQQALANASQTYATAAAQAQHDYDCGLASAPTSGQESQAARDYRMAVAQATGAHGEALAQADVDYVDRSTPHETNYTASWATASQAYAQHESTAYQQMLGATAGREAAFAQSRAATAASALAALVQDGNRPWSALESARAEALEDWTATVAGAGATRQTSIANAQQGYELSLAAADAVFANASTAAELAEALADANQALAEAQAERAELVAQAQAGENDVTWPDMPQVGDLSAYHGPYSAAVDYQGYTVGLPNMLTGRWAGYDEIAVGEGVWGVDCVENATQWHYVIDVESFSYSLWTYWGYSPSGQFGVVQCDEPWFNGTYPVPVDGGPIDDGLFRSEGTGADLFQFAGADLPSPDATSLAASAPLFGVSGTASLGSAAEDYEELYPDDYDDSYDVAEEVTAEGESVAQLQAEDEETASEHEGPAITLLYKTTDFNNYPVARMEELVTLNLAYKSSDGKYVAVVDIVGTEVRCWLFKLVDEAHRSTYVAFAGGPAGVGYGYVRTGQQVYRLVESRFLAEVQEDGTILDSGGETLECLLARLRTTAFTDTVVSSAKAKESLQDSQRTLAVVEFCAALVPGVATTDYAQKGEWGNFAISLAGDLSFLASFGVGGAAKGMMVLRAANAAKCAQTARTAHYVSAGIESAIAATRVGQGIYELGRMDGDTVRAGGYIGEAALRMLGARVNLKAAKSVGNSLVAAGDDAARKAAANVGSGRILAKVFDSFEAFARGRTFASPAEARKAWQVYQRAAQSRGLIIGKTEEILRHAGQEGRDVLYFVLDAKAPYGGWTWEINRAWLDGAVDARLTVKVLTPASELPKSGALWREFNYLIWKGYKPWGGLLVPPVP